MRRLAIALALLLVGLSGPVAAKRIAKDYRDIETPTLNKVEVPEPQRHELPNGLVVYTLEDHELPLVGGQAIIRAGSNYDSMVSVGLANLFTTVMRTGGTAKMGGDALDEALESRAASIEAYTSRDRMTVSFSSLSDDLDYVLGLYADLLLEPIFAQEKLELAKVAERSAIARRNDSPFDITQREFGKAIYGPLSSWARYPEYDTINNISRDMLSGFHSRYIAPNNTIMGVWGDFDTAELMALIKKKFGDWDAKNLDAPPVPAVPSRTRRSVHVINKEDVEQANIRIGHMGVRRDHPDAYALEVLSEILGSGFSSRLFRRVRSDEGLAYFVGASFDPAYDRPGLFAVYGGTKNESVKRTLSIILEEIERIRNEPVTADELENAKAGLLNSFVFNFDSKSDLVARQLLYAYYDYPSDYLEKYQPGISAVTVEAVQRAAREHIKPQQFVTLVVGRVDAFDGSLEDFGKVHQEDIGIPEPGAYFEYIHSEETHLKWAKELVDQAIEDMGGLEALKRIETLHLEWDFELQGRNGPIKGTGRRVFDYPNRVRDEMQLPHGQQIQVLADGEGWRSLEGTVRALDYTQNLELEDMLLRDPITLLRRIGTGELLVYLPWSLQRRFLEGLQIPLAMAAGVGLAEVLLPQDQDLRSRWQWLARSAIIALSTISNLFLTAGATLSAASHSPDLFSSTEILSAADWLGDNSTWSETVLAGPYAGNLIPARIGHQVMLGHEMETVEYDSKLEAMIRFFDAATPDEERQTLIREWGIVYVFYGPEERSLGDFVPASASWLIPSFRAGEMIVYRVSQSAQE